MKKINRRDFLKVAGATGVAGFMAGCGASGDAASSSSTVNEEGKSVIRYALWEYTNTVGAQRVVEGFLAAHPEYEVEILDEVSGDYTQKLTIMLNGGADVDVYNIKDPDGAVGFYSRNQTEDLTPYIEASGMDISSYKSLADQFLMDGKQAALPILLDNYTLLYNKALFDAAGVEYPGEDITWEEYEELVGIMTTEDHYGAYVHSWATGTAVMGLAMGKNSLFDTDCSYLKPYYEMNLRMQKNGQCLDYAAITTGSLHYTSTWVTNDYAMMTMGTWYYNNLIGKIDRGEVEMDWDVVRFPHVDDSDIGYTTGLCTPIAMNSNAKNKEGAWALIEYISSEEGAKAYAGAGKMPILLTDPVMEVIENVPNMAPNVRAAMTYTNIVLDRPVAEGATAVMKIMDEEHSLIMLEQVELDEGLANMGARIADTIGG